MLEQIVTAVVTALATSMKLGREAAAANLEEIARKIRSGALIPDEAFKSSQADKSRYAEIRDYFKRK